MNAPRWRANGARASGAEAGVTLVVHPGSAIGRAAADRFAAAGGVVRSADDEACLTGSALQACVGAYGRLDVLVIAGSDNGMQFSPDSPPAGAPARIDVFLRSTFFVAQAAVRAMGAGGRICVAAPPRSPRVAVDMPAPATLVEGGIIAMVRLLAVELAPRIRVNAVCPVGSGADLATVADTLAFLASKDASYMTGAFVPVPGSTRRPRTR
jgi:meso-butanediol dehydrogenase/(S,S)-butanediol dehydrogenase/diacetyl reductase